MGKKLRLNKILLNNVSTTRHESKLIAAVSQYTDFDVLGVVPKMSNSISERHLGLVPTFQHPEKEGTIIININYKDNTDYKKLLPAKPKKSQRVNQTYFKK